MQEKSEKDFYERVINVVRDKKAYYLYRISERDSLKGIRVTYYDLEREMVLREYKCGN